MTGNRIAHLVRGLIVAIGLALAVVHLGLLSEGTPRQLVDVVIPVRLIGR